LVFPKRLGPRDQWPSLGMVVKHPKTGCLSRFFHGFEESKNFCEFFATMRLTVRWEGSYNPDH
jgi:hypothetical protein